MNPTLIIAVLCMLAWPRVLGQTNVTNQTPATMEKRLENLFDQYASAAKDGDLTFIEKDLARDYIGIEADGHLTTKPEILELYRSGQVKFERLEVKDRKARVYRNIAVVVGELEMKGHSGRAELNGTYRCTRVLEKMRHGQWQSVNFQLTKLQ
jgi:hypothetical protein